MKTLGKLNLAVGLLIVLFVSQLAAQAPYRVDSDYEDTIRIAIIWNDALGNACTNSGLHQPVGEKTRDFVLKALDITQVPNIRVLKNTTASQVSWAQIQALWAPKLPHVIVHVNAGWSVGWNTATLQNTLSQAVSNKVGVVSVGDDAADLADVTFGFTGLDNVPPPLGDGTTINNLWIGLLRANDNRLKIYNSSGDLAYPGVNGIISNAIDKILINQQVMQFKPLNNGRCQADADQYTILYPQWLTMLGYQQGTINNNVRPSSTEKELDVLVAIQDTLPDLTIRRAVAVSFQPQFLANDLASQQIVYDAVMFASLAHTLSVPTRLVIKTTDTSMTAGDTIPLLAYIIDQKGDTILDPAVNARIQWFITQPSIRAGDQLLANSGRNVRFTATMAYRAADVYAILDNNLADTATITILHAAANHLVVEGSANAFAASPNRDNPIGGNSSITLSSAETQRSVYAILRDRFQNYVANSGSTRWDTLPPIGIVTARVGLATTGEGIITKSGPSGTTTVRATDIPSSFSSNLRITIESVTYDSLRIMQYDVAQGRYNRIVTLTMQTSDSTTLLVQGLRTDRLGPPGSGGWVDVTGNWGLSANIHTTPTPPSGQTLWSFSPNDTGHGTLSVALPAGNPKTAIPVIFLPGVARRLAIYTTRGAPSPGQQPQPAVPFTADTVAAGTSYNKLYAKLFDENGIFLSQFETSATLSQQIGWSLTPTVEASLSQSNGYATALQSIQAYRTVQVTATWNSLSYSVQIYIKPGVAHHLVIEATPDIQNFIDDQPLNRLVIPSIQSVNSAFGILRDQYGNFVNYSKAATWASLDTALFTTYPGVVAVGEGYAERKADVGTANMVARDTIYNFRDTVLVELQNITYTALRIYLLDNGPKYIDSVSIRTDDRLTLYVEGQRSDNKAWENVAGTWSTTGSLITVGAAPTSADQWAVTPDSVGTGWIKVKRDGATTDSVWATFLPGLPGSMALYRLDGNPLTQIPYLVPPKTDTIVAGSTAPIIAKIFDRNGIWLSYYENSTVSKPLISWSITQIAGPVAPVRDTLSTRSGYKISFKPTHAYSTYAITAQFREGTKTFSATMQLAVVAAEAAKLVIEGSANITDIALITSQPLPQIEFSSRDTIKNAFAIIRDQFDNFVNHSSSTDWKSLDVKIVTATEGNAPKFGEGKVTRIGPTGKTVVVATNSANKSLFDSVNVVLSAFSYDSLRIVVKDSISIDELTMRSDQDTTLQVQGKRSYDGVWVPVDGNWSYKSTNGSLTASATSLWDFAPGDTGTGIIIVSRTSSVPDTITVKVKPGKPAQVVIYPKEGPIPNPNNLPYAGPSTGITVVAGSRFPLVTKVLDRNGVWLSDYELQSKLSQQISWVVEEFSGYDSSGILDDTLGHSRTFTPIRAHQSVYIITQLQFENRIMADTVRVTIIPGEPRQLVLEGSPNWQASPHHPNPIATVEITDSMITASVFAILRDSLGNYIRYSSVAEWGVVNNDTIISVRDGNTILGEGVITRNLREGTAKVFGVDILGFRDTVDVALLPYYYTELRIVSGVNRTQIESLTMTTNDDTTLFVQGLRSDTALWVTVDARWENSTNLNITPQAPGKSNNWGFSPNDTGSGFIRVTMDNDAVTLPDTIQVHFLVGPPTKVKIELITPPEQRIAGEPIRAIVTIENRNGRVPGKFCYNGDSDSAAVYTDILGPGGRPKPFVLIGEDTLWLGSDGSQCFLDGTDTITITLFHVPEVTDSFHRITVTLATLQAKTPPFSILPGALDSLVLERQAGTWIGDTLTLHYPEDQVIITAVGYDMYGNRIGPVLSNWSTDSTLHPIQRGTNTERIIYSSTSITDNENGTITAHPVDSASASITASVFIKMVGPLITLTSATTRDANGNGYLDQMELTLSRPIFLEEGFTFKNMEVKYGNTTFTIDSIIGGTGRTDSTWVVALHEVKNNTPQTAWVPYVSYEGVPELGLGAANNHVATDGAGPVVWSVTKTIQKEYINDRSHDEVTIIFSEEIQRATNEGQSLVPTDTIGLIVYVWESIADPDDATKTKLVKVDSMLTGISALAYVGKSDFGGTVLTFVTATGIDIAPRNYVSIKTSTSDSGVVSAYITDHTQSSNLPEGDNQRVRVIITGPSPQRIVIAPNPSRASFKHTPAGVFSVTHNPDAKRWVYQEKAGVLMRFTMRIPPREENVTITCSAAIYDGVGNHVVSNVNNDLGSTLPSDALDGSNSTYDVDIYWNGSNQSGMPVAPGVYRIILSIKYSKGQSDVTLRGNIGIRK